MADDKERAEALLPAFKLERILNHGTENLAFNYYLK
jgi:hypothetical protein